MRILVIDIENLGLDFVLRCAEFGNDVRWYRYSKGNKEIRDGEGFKGFKIVDDWRPSMPWAKDGLIVLTGNFLFTRELDRYREIGYKIFGPTYASAQLEISRAAGMESMKEAGIELAPYVEYKSLEEAERAAMKLDKPTVFKCMGSEDDKSMTYVSCDPADMVGWLRVQIERGKKLAGGCMLQEKIDMLAEVGVSGWFGPDGFLPGKWNVCWEHKKLGNDETGPNCGESGTVMQYVQSDKIANDILLPMVGKLRSLGHRGDFALGAGIDKQGKIWPFEWTARCGYPAWYIQMASHKGDPAQWMRDLLDGKDTLKVSNDVAIGVVMGIPRYPYNASPPELVTGKPIYGLDEVWDDVHLASVMLGKGPKMKSGKIVEAPIHMTTGEYVLCATGLGKTVEVARKKVYKTVDAIKLGDSIYRTDIGIKVQEKLPALHKLGFCLDMEP